jgi:hypothetical protein
VGLNYPKSGLNNVSEYQVSGYPWTTGSIFPSNKYWMEIQFPRLAKGFIVKNLDAGHIYPSGSVSGKKELFVFFGDVSTPDNVQPTQISNNHFVTIPEDKNEVSFGVKCAKIYIGCHDTSSIGGFQVMAELSGISSFEMPRLVGSGIDV